MNWQIVSAVGGLAIGVITVIIGLITYVSPRSAPPSDPDVSVISRSVERLADVELKVEDEPGGRDDSSAPSVQDNVIDVQLQNEGGTPALVTAVEASVSYARKMQLCPGIGGEILYASALYDVRVPVFTLPSVPTFPVKVEKKLPFRIDPNSFDRLAIAVGPEKISSDDGPWVYILDLSLRMQNSEPIKLGKFALISPASQVSMLTKNLAELPEWGRDYAGCHEKNWESIVSAMDSGGEMAPSLLTLHDQYKSSPYLLAPGQERKFLTIDYDWSKVSGVVDCGNPDHPARGVQWTFEDVTGDDNKDAIVGLTCAVGDDGYIPPPISVVLIDGVLKNGSPRVIQKLLDSGELKNIQRNCVPEFRSGMLYIKLISYPHGDTTRPDSIVVTHTFRWIGTAMMAIGTRTERSCVS